MEEFLAIAYVGGALVIVGAGLWWFYEHWS
jgi:hypothetical protein